MSQPQNEKKLRMMHVVNLMSIAYADGEISEEEKDIVVNIAQKLELTEEEFKLCFEHWKSNEEEEIPIAVPESDDEQVEFLKHFTLVMMADGTIEDSEKAHLAKIADIFGYDPEKVIPMLINDVYQEYFADDDDESGDEEEEEDDLFEDTDYESQLEMGKIYLEEKNVEQAFDELFLPALRNGDACSYFMIIPNTDTRLFRLSQEQIDLVKVAAEKGYPLANYVLGRYHQVVKPEKGFIAKAKQCLEKALDGGIADARWALSRLYLYGYLGQVDIDTYRKALDNAFDDGSMQAFKQKLSDMIHGEGGESCDPKSAIKIIENFLSKDEEYAAIYPDMCFLLGEAYQGTGNKNKADQCYEQAIDHGYFEAEAKRFENRVEGPDKDFYRETMSMLLDFGCDYKDPGSFLARALEYAYNSDKEEDKKKKAEWHKKIKDDLTSAFELGNGDAAYYIGLYCYKGSYGFGKDSKEAWDWFIKGQDLDSGLAFEGTAMMITDGVHPSNTPDDYLEYCKREAQLHGVGKPAKSKEVPAVVIVNPEGKATIYKLEKEEWYKLSTLIGAKRLAPLRLDALDKIGKEAGLGEHLVAWIDIDAPRKGLATNKTASSFYPGIVAGDVVLSLADGLYDPMPFYGIDEAKVAAGALKAKVTAVVTDLSEVSSTKNDSFDYSNVNPYVDHGYVARIEPDGKAYIVENSLAVFSLIEEEIYDPARLPKLHEIGKKLGLKGRLTLWTDNSALRKQLAIYNKFTKNTIASKFYPGPVADNAFIAMEDEDCRIMLFDDAEQLKAVCLALGVKPEDIQTQD